MITQVIRWGFYLVILQVVLRVNRFGELYAQVYTAGWVCLVLEYIVILITLVLLGRALFLLTPDVPIKEEPREPALEFSTVKEEFVEPSLEWTPSPALKKFLTYVEAHPEDWATRDPEQQDPENPFVFGSGNPPIKVN